MIHCKLRNVNMPNEIYTLKNEKENLLNRLKFLECERENVIDKNKALTIGIEKLKKGL